MFRINKLLDQRSFHLVCRHILAFNGFCHHIFQDGGDRKALHALAPPIRSQPGRVDTPNLLGITLKEKLIEWLSESVDVKILQ